MRFLLLLFFNLVLILSFSTFAKLHDYSKRKYQDLVQLLLALKLIDKNYNWIAGNTYLVNTSLIAGDLDTEKISALLFALQEQANEQQGKVIQLRDVANINGSASNTYKALLNTAPSMVKINETLLSFGGLSSDIFDLNLQEINTLPLNQYRFLNYHGSSVCHPYSEAFNAERILKVLGAKQAVIGNSIPSNKISYRFDHQAYFVNTGDVTSALVIDNNQVSAFYLKQGQLIKAPINEKKTNPIIHPETLTEARIKDILLHGDIVGNEEIGVGITNSNILTLSWEGVKIRALFKVHDSDPNLENEFRFPRRINHVPDRYLNEVAAYKLDRLLNLNLVPIAVLRKINNREGVIQYWVEGLQNELDRKQNQLPFTGECNRVEQFRTRYIFDVLIYNDDRNETNITFSQEQQSLVFIDHSIAFSLEDSAPKMYAKAPLRLSNIFAQRLKSLNETLLKEELSDYLHRKQIDSILKRRDHILETAITP